jgi:hypothetical protein
MRGLPLFLLTAALCVTWPARSRACSCGVQEPRFAVDPAVALPADARGVLYFAEGGWVVDPGGATDLGYPPLPAASGFAIERADGAPIPHRIDVLREPGRWRHAGVVAYGLVVRADEALPPGRYRFIGPELDPFDKPEQVEVEIGPLAVPSGAAPTIALGPEEHGPLTVGVGVSCSAEVTAAHRTLAVTLPAELAPVASTLLYTTLVDGIEWRPSASFCTSIAPGDSWQGRGKERLFAVCDSPMPVDTGLAPNVEHTVSVRVQAPGSRVVLSSAPVAVTLPCPPKPDDVASAEVEPAALPASDGGCGSCGVPRSRPTGPLPAGAMWGLGALGLLACRWALRCGRSGAS